MPTIEVTVDLDDLEALIYASAAIKNIEGVLVSYRRDPFVQQMAGKFLPAQKRLETAVRNAKRSAASGGDTKVHFNEPMTEQMRAGLVILFSTRDQYGYTDIQLKDVQKEKPYLDALSVRGYIDVGQYVYGGQWTGDEYPIVRLDPARYMIRFTARGEKMAEILIEEQRMLEEQKVLTKD